MTAKARTSRISNVDSTTCSGPQPLILSEPVEIKKTAFGLACGLLWGFGVFVATLWVMIRGGGEHLELINRFYVGYDVSALGAVVGFVYGFVDGFIGGWLLAWLYNRFAGVRPAT